MGKVSRAGLGGGCWRRGLAGGPCDFSENLVQCSAMCQHGVTLGKSLYLPSLGFLNCEAGMPVVPFLQAYF